MSDGIRHFWTHIAGVKHRNPDGTSRQRVIRELEPLTLLKLDEEPDNPHDPCAVRVSLADGRQLGYLPREVARDVMRKRESGCWHRAVITRARESVASQTGGQVLEGGEYLRVDILVVEAEDYVTDPQVHAHLDAVAAEALAKEAAAPPQAAPAPHIRLPQSAAAPVVATSQPRPAPVQTRSRGAATWIPAAVALAAVIGTIVVLWLRMSH